MNLTPKASQWAQGASGDGWSVLWEFWDEEWMEAQLDDAVDMGCNVVRVMGSLLGIHLGNYTRETYLGLWDDLNTMCEAKGLYLYPVINPGHAERIPMSQDFLQTEASAFAEHVNGYNNCIGIDVIQEDHDYGRSLNGLELMRVLRRVTDLPLTYSIVGGTPSQLGHADNTFAMNSVVNRVDFIDLHWYYSPAETDIETHYWDAGFLKPILIGEFGSPLSAGSSAQTARYEAIVDALAYEGDSGHRPAGALAWCARDFGTNPATEMWGLSEEDGTRRTWIETPFKTIPTE